MNLEKKDEDEVYIPFQGLDKGVVLQEKRLFNESPLNPRKCCMLLTKVMYLLVRGQEFTTNEATELFFSVTKLFQSKDVTLRRLVYLVLKELLPLAEDVIIVISCLTKDMNSKTDLYRANSIRVLCKINDVSMLGQTERYLKQAIVDKEPYVASAALVSGVHLMKASPAGVDIVKRWFSEIQSAVKSKAVMVQYHALGLLHQIKRHDRLAVSKLVSEMTRSPVRSHYAHCLLIRFTCQVMNDEDDPSERARLYEYLDSCIRHKSEIVIYEAARGICNLRNVTSKELTPAISALQILLANSQKPTLRFAAVRTLNKVAMTHPLPVTACNLDMENLISDPNRSIATLAITTLLKTGSETSVDRLMKQISNFMNEISDEFKIVVVDAIKTLCLKYKQKHRTLMNFLSNMLRDEGGFQYKKAIVDTILVIIAALPEAKEAGLSHLCEFIEDCEFTALSTKILHLLGKEGPTTSCPPKYIRYIYNRVILESANVRASAVSALANFAVSLPDLQPRIITLLKRCLHDNDDEVRDRATFYLSLLQKDQVLARQLIVEGFPIPLDNLERSLQSYKASPSHIPFDIESVPKVSLEPEKEIRATPGLPLPTKAAPVSGYSEALQQIAEFAGLGPLFRSSKPLELTESETEYVVNCVKHVFLNHIVFQFNCTNTLKDQFLEGVTVKMDLAMASNFSLESETSPVSLPYQVPGAFYVCVRHEPDDFATGTFANTLRFSVHEVDPSTGKPDESSYDDDYQLEDIEVAQSDYMKKVASSNFKDEWEALGEDAEYVDKFDLPTFQSLKEAVNEIIDTLGMQPCDNSENVAPKKTQHQLFLSGIFVGEVQVLARVRMILDPAKGVGMQLAVRSSDPAVSKAVGSAF